MAVYSTPPSKGRRRAMVIAAAALLALFALLYWLLVPAPAVQTQRDFSVIATQRGPIVAQVSANGVVQAQADAVVNFTVGGVVSDVLVLEGDNVSRGQVLARLRSGELELELLRAETQLRQSEASRERLLAGATPEEIEYYALRGEVDRAKQQLDRLLAWPTSSDRSLAQSALRQARTQRDQARDRLEQREQSLPAATRRAQQAYDDAAALLKTREAGGASAEQLDEARAKLDEARAELDEARLSEESGLAQAQGRLDEAELALDEAERRVEELDRGPALEEIHAAQQQLEQARQRLEQLLGEAPSLQARMAERTQAQPRSLPSPADLELANAQLDSSKTTYELARLRLDQTLLRAPFDGVVADVQLVPGTPPQRGVTLVDASAFYVEATVDEIDVAQVLPGQPVSVTLDALPGNKLDGSIEFVAPLSFQQSGAITYKVLVALRSPSPQIRSGMSAAVMIEVARRDSALLIPRRALRTAGARTFVELVTGEAPMQGLPPRREIEVQTGVSNERVIEVLGGLAEGDQVYVDGVSIDFFELIMGG